MPQIVKAYHSQAILVQNLRELVGNEVRLQQIPQQIHAHKIYECWIIVVSAQLPLVDLLLPQVSKVLISKLAEGQGPHAGIGLGGVFPDDGPDFAVVLLSDNGSDDTDGPLLEVNGRPAKPQQFRAAQSIKARQEDGNGNRLIGRRLEQSCDLRNGVGLIAVVPDVAGFLGKVRHVLSDIAVLHGPLQSRADHSMVLDNGVWTKPVLDFKRIVVLQVTRCQLADSDSFLVKIWLDVLGQNVVVLVVGRDGDIGPVGLQPLGDVLGQGLVHWFNGLIPLILDQKLIQHHFSPTLVVSDRQIEVDPLLDPFAVLVPEIQNGVILITLDL